MKGEKFLHRVVGGYDPQKGPRVIRGGAVFFFVHRSDQKSLLGMNRHAVKRALTRKHVVDDILISLNGIATRDQGVFGKADRADFGNGKRV